MSRSTPNYGALCRCGHADIGDGIRVFAGQRLDGFYVDLGSVFDLAVLRPFQSLHLIPTTNADGVNALRAFNVHTIAIQVPIARLTKRRKVPTDVTSRDAVLGVWASSHRQKLRYQDEYRTYRSGPYTQVSRLAQSVVQRGHRADEPQGPVEPAGAAVRLEIRRVRRQAGAGEAAAGALSRECSPTSPR